MKHAQRMHIIYALLFIAIAVLLILAIPWVPQTQITIVTNLDFITNVSVDTPRIPLLIWLIPSSSPPIGAYTINVNASQNGFLTFNSTLQNVPSGQYTFVWVRYGQPENGTYHIVVQLLRNNAQVNSYSLDVSYG